MASTNTQSAAHPASSGGALKSAYTNAQLYALVAEIAEQVRPEHPEKISTRQFDGARAASGHSNAPSGRWIAKRLGHSWPEVVEVALDPERNVVMTDSAARRPAAEKWLNLRHLHFALRYVARERGEDSFTAIEYADTRARLLKADSHRTGGDVATILPTQGQIIQIARRLEAQADADKAATAKATATAAAEEAAAATKKAPKKPKKSAKPKKVTAPPLPEIEVEQLDEAAALGWWNKALVLAGIRPHEVDYSKGVKFPAAISLYIDACGLLPPNRKELKRFAAIAGFALSRPAPEHGTAILPYLPAVAALRSARSLPMADEFADMKSKPTFDLSALPSDLPRRAPGNDYWTANPDKVIDALCEYLDTLAPRHQRAATRNDYMAQQAGHGGEWPSASTLGRVGEKSFSKWIARAEPEWQERLAAKKTSAQAA